MQKPYFEPVVIRGETFDLAHLDPFSFEFFSKKAKKNLRVHVTFANHCFTKKLITEEYIDGDPVFDAGSTRPRMFCEIRYRLSLDLHSVIDSLNDARVKVWETAAQRNWAHSITIDDPSGPYHIFFEVRRASRDRRNYQDINLVVESAYHEDPENGPPILNGSMNFQLLCGKVYLGEATSTKR